MEISALASFRSIRRKERPSREATGSRRESVLRMRRPLPGILIFFFYFSSLSFLGGEPSAPGLSPRFYPDPLATEGVSPSGSPLHRDHMVRLYSAPLLNQEKIERAALLFEERTRRALAEEMKQTHQALCGLPEEQRESELHRLGRELSRQKGAWNNIQRRFETMLAFRLKKGLMEEDFQRVQELRKPVITLQQERTALLTRSWRNYMDHLEQHFKGETGCSPLTEEEIRRFQPLERLYLPLYLATFRFFDSLPTEFRLQLILSLKNG